MSETKLEVFGPITISFESNARKKRITKENKNSFWGDKIARRMAKKQGCYIFALRAGKGYTPWYVGRATKSFEQEIFTDHKTGKYNGLLWEGRKGTPAMFFVALGGGNVKISEPLIKDLEKFLIQSAVLKNKELLNCKNIKNLPEWSIKGVIRGGQGKPPKTSQVFRNMMGL